MMKSHRLVLITLSLLNPTLQVLSQDKSISPSFTVTGEYLGATPPLAGLPSLSEAEWQELVLKAEQKMRNPKLRVRSYPYAETALPKGPDPAWQRTMGASRDTRAPLANFAGLTSASYPPDANGTIGPNHYMQTVNSVYAIYTRSGALVAGPTALNTLFTGLPGSSCNDGDPIVLYDDQADRWLLAEFSICGTNDYMLIAVSTTSNPAGTWHKYSFDVDDLPDFEKFGIWRDGYYMGTNNPNGNDIYVFERSQMLIGGTAQAIGFNNPWRPTTIDGFVCVPPLDNDGPFAPVGEPGLFIAFNDDAIGGGSDQLWVYELDVNWETLAYSTFTRTQQIAVASFDSNFGSTWENIEQQATTRKLDAIPMVIMNPPQYRNFGSYETIVCCHTVDVDNTDHAGIRWYELRRVSSGNWTIRQQGTYAPDSHSRWMGSIMLNNQNEIALGYSISSSTLYPGIRYCGQSASAYSAATGTLDEAEEIIHSGSYSQIVHNRWGDYASLQIDPVNEETFWFTTEYIGGGGSRNTKIASFQIGPVLLAAHFAANNTNPAPNTAVNFYDYSTGSPITWSWSFTPNSVTYLNGTSSSSQNPVVSFNNPGSYTVSLYIYDGTGSDTETRNNYINIYTPGLWTGTVSTEWTTAANWHGSFLPDAGTSVNIPSSAVNWPVFTGNFTVGTQCSSLTLNNSSQMTVNGNFTIDPGTALNMTGGGTLNITGNWINNGNFTTGAGTINFSGNNPASVSTQLTIDDIAAYSISTFPQGMTALTGASTGPSGDDNNVNISLGFEFNYSGSSYNSARISTNGWLSLNLTGDQGYANTTLFTGTSPNVTITAWWDDLRDDGTSAIYYKTEGAAPYRVFTAEWKRVLVYSSFSTARISFQVKLYETNNLIEFHYGDLEAGTHFTLESASIGIEDDTGGPGHFKETTTGSTTVGVSDLTSAEDWPAVNYRYTPGSLNINFKDVTISKSGSYVNVISNTDVSGSLTISPASAIKIAPGIILKVLGTGN